MESEIKKYAVFFDLDLTVLNVNSGPVLIMEAYKKGLMGTGSLLNAILQAYLYKFNLRDTNVIISKMGLWLKGMKNETLEDLSEEVVEKYLKNAIRPEIINEITRHKENNGQIIILSSVLSSISGPLGKYINADGVICTQMEIKDGKLTGYPAGKFCYGSEKRERLLAYCKEKNLDPAESWYYADSISDYEAFEAVGHQVCVCPDKKLAAKAAKKGWKIYWWN
jgi:putative phosphoserine phosphatase / 1-acylglycerol-3-phosphate O-acyltransferase